MTGFYFDFFVCVASNFRSEILLFKIMPKDIEITRIYDNTWSSVPCSGTTKKRAI